MLDESVFTDPQKNEYEIERLLACFKHFYCWQPAPLYRKPEYRSLIPCVYAHTLLHLRTVPRNVARELRKCTSGTYFGLWEQKGPAGKRVARLAQGYRADDVGTRLARADQEPVNCRRRLDRARWRFLIQSVPAPDD